MASSQPLGLATGQPILNPMSTSFGFLKDLLSPWFDLNLTQVSNIVAFATLGLSSLDFAQATARRLYSWFLGLFRPSIDIPGHDPLNASVLRWVVDHRPATYRSFTGTTARGANSRAARRDDPGAQLKKNPNAIHYSAHWKTRYLIHNCHLFIISRKDAAAFTPGPNSSYSESDLKVADLTISCLSWSVEPIKSLITECRAYADQQAQYFVIIFAWSHHFQWQPTTRKPIRNLNTVHLDDDVKDGLVKDLGNHLDEKTQARYRSRSMPYRRGYLLYGPPGTGKSTLCIALAGHFGMDIYEIKIPSVESDADLEEAFRMIRPRCIILLEDVDAVWTPRTAAGSEQEEDTKKSSGNRTANCTLSGVLNALDGVASEEGRIVIMTTNHPERLDKALVRPGRVDRKVLLGNISPKSASDMFVRMFSPDLFQADTNSATDKNSGDDKKILSLKEVRAMAAQFAEKIPKDTFTPSHLQGFFQLHLESAKDALASIEEWVRKERELIMAEKKKRDEWEEAAQRAGVGGGGFEMVP